MIAPISKVSSTRSCSRKGHSHCWQPTNLPRFDGGATSVIYQTLLALSGINEDTVRTQLTYTGTCAEQIPTASPLIMRPTISMPILCDAQTRIEPIHLDRSLAPSRIPHLGGQASPYQMIQPIWIDFFLPRISER